jgi:hypothetical protein
METTNNSVMGLNFIKEINGFKNQCEAYQTRQQKNDCQHIFSIK